MRRVVVTGLGMVTPLGCGVEPTWRRLLAGDSGARRIETFDVSDLPAKIGCIIPRGDGSAGTYDPDQWMEPKEQRKVDEFITYAMCAARQALDDAGWRPTSYQDQTTTGVVIGSGIGGIEGIAETAITLKEKGPRRVSPFFIPGRIINLASGYVSIEFGLKGPNHAVVTACSTGAHAIGDAGRLIALGDADVMVAGGAESPVNRLSLAGFAACRALSTGFNDQPTRASRPYDKDRDGFVMGEGAGLVVLEEREHALARGARIYAELIGYGLSGDAYHITSPDPEGDGALRCMSMAIKRAGISAADIDYINAHGTSTPVGDEIELGAVQRLVGNAASRVAMSSTKSSIGHLLGAAGAVEAIFSVLAIRDQVVPPTINLDNPSVESPIDLVPHRAQNRHIHVVLSNSFGFRGDKCVAGVPWRGRLSSPFRHIWPRRFGYDRPTDMRPDAANTRSRGNETGFPLTEDPAAGAPRFATERLSLRSPRTALEPERVPEPYRPSRRARNPFVVAGSALFTVILLVAVVAAFALAAGRQRFETPGPLEADKMVNIPRGLGLRDIADLLQREGVISQSWVFIGGVLVRKAYTDLKAGEYDFRKQASVADVVNTLVEGKVVLHGVTIPEGLTSEQVVARLMESPILTGNIKEIPKEGTLLPETYNFSRGTPREHLIQQMQQKQHDMVQRIWERRSGDLPIKTPEQLVVLASIIEKETGKPDERTRVAAVFVNRLKQRMKLQSDPTIIYGLVGGKGTLGRPIMRSEIEQPTPYNTYVIDGLPPGPIANPGRASLEAAANPARTRELYFVADGTGGHAFSESLDQHQKSVTRLRQMEQQQRGEATKEVTDAPAFAPVPRAGAPAAAPPAPARAATPPRNGAPRAEQPKKRANAQRPAAEQPAPQQ